MKSKRERMPGVRLGVSRRPDEAVVEAPVLSEVEATCPQPNKADPLEEAMDLLAGGVTK